MAKKTAMFSLLCQLDLERHFHNSWCLQLRKVYERFFKSLLWETFRLYLHRNSTPDCNPGSTFRRLWDLWNNICWSFKGDHYILYFETFIDKDAIYIFLAQDIFILSIICWFDQSNHDNHDYIIDVLMEVLNKQVQ